MSFTRQLHRGLRETAFIVFAAVSLYLWVSLFTFNSTDPAWSHSTVSSTVTNSGGVVGAWFADISFFLFGYLAYVLPVTLLFAGWYLFRSPSANASEVSGLVGTVRVIGFLLTLGASTGISHLHFSDPNSKFSADSGGLLGSLVSNGLVSVFNSVGGTLFLLALLIIGISLATGLSWLGLIDGIGKAIMRFFCGFRRRMQENKMARAAQKQRVEVVKKDIVKNHKRIVPSIMPPAKKPVVSSSVRKLKEKQLKLFEGSTDDALPTLDLLEQPTISKHKVAPAALEAMARQVELKLKDFNIDAEVVAVYPGPIVTRYELQPSPGTKGSQVINLAKDLARSLSVVSVRVVDVIPGKSVIGLEIPNEHREMVRLVEVLQSKEYENSGSPLTLVLGKDIGGHPAVSDLAKMPHLLVAGTTGSGKSVAVNAMILSILFNATPKEVKMIMIDPKMLELSIYDGIPHLLTPVVTDMKDASTALRWCVAEMERRYKLMSMLGVRNLAGYNRKVKEAIKSGEPIPDPLHPEESAGFAEDLETIPSIVVIVDELADMMMIVGKKVEEYIARLAQKARAAGIHLILATQRPSVDVLTGLIKSNIPTRISFQVSSKIDSRTIIDQMGAEQLLGHGDMLYLTPGGGVPTRFHGAFVADQEVHNVVDDLKRRGKPEYNDEILSGDPLAEGIFVPGEPASDDPEADPLYDQAVSFVIENRKASISSVQRKLKIGYNRAARMVEAMESAGVVSSPLSNGQREVLSPPMN